MTDIIRTVAADLLEAPEEASKLLGKALEVMSDELRKFGDRIAALEDQVRGQ